MIVAAPRLTLLFASLHVLLFLLLSLRVVLYRNARQIGVGNGGDPVLTRRVRVHANFSEYVPLALLLLAPLEITGLAGTWIAVLGAVLLLGRVLHALGLGGSGGYSFGRFGGTLLTWGALLVMALLGIWRFAMAAML